MASDFVVNLLSCQQETSEGFYHRLPVTRHWNDQLRKHPWHEYIEYRLGVPDRKYFDCQFCQLAAVKDRKCLHGYLRKGALIALAEMGKPHFYMGLVTFQVKASDYTLSASRGWQSVVLGGWDVAAVATIQSGTPLTIADTALDGVVRSLRIW